MKLDQIKKLEDADQVILNLNKYADPTQAIINVGQELYELGLVKDPNDLHEILKVYNKDVLNKIRKEEDKWIIKLRFALFLK